MLQKMPVVRVGIFPTVGLRTPSVTPRRESHPDCRYARNSASSYVEAFLRQLPPYFPHAVDLEILIEHSAYLDLHSRVATSTERQAVHVRGWAMAS